MIDVTQDIQSMTTFKRNSSGLMKRMKKTGRPLVLTVKGKAAAVLLDAAAYRDVADHLDAVAGVRRGLAQAKKGLGRSVDEVFDSRMRYRIIVTPEAESDLRSASNYIRGDNPHVAAPLAHYPERCALTPESASFNEPIRELFYGGGNRGKSPYLRIDFLEPMDALRFACQPGCTNCCNMEGYVYLTEDDLKRAAKFTGLSARTFEARYVYRTRHQRRFRKPADKQCPFLEEHGCSIHPAKPTQCRTFPFWPELVGQRSEWKSTAHYCPGIGKGELIQIGSAMEIAEEQRQAYPEMYK